MTADDSECVVQGTPQEDPVIFAPGSAASDVVAKLNGSTPGTFSVSDGLVASRLERGRKGA